MSRHAFRIAVTVDVDDPTAIAAAAIDEDGVPDAGDAIAAAIVDAFVTHALPTLDGRGIHIESIGHSTD